MALDFSAKILVVEDSGFTRRMEVKVLKDVGFTNIVEAEDGDDGIKKLQEENDISLIISDWNMPNRDGYDLLVWVRESDEFSEVPFIMASARGEKSQTAKAREAGVSDFIGKPFGPPELIEVVERVFGGNSEKEEEPEAAPEAPRICESGKVALRAAYIQITDHLPLGVMKNMISTGELQPQNYELETVRMPSWNPVQKALEENKVDVAFILAPIAMDLFNYDVPIKLVMFAHKNGSILVQKKRINKDKSLQDYYRGRTFYIPHILSIHHMLINMFLKEIGMKPGLPGQPDVDVFLEVVPPVKMPEILAENENAGGYIVAEPLGTKSIAAGSGELVFLSGELWNNHPCCVVVARDDFIKSHPDAVQEFVDLMVESGQFINKNPIRAAQIGVDFLDPEKNLGLNESLLKNVLTEQNGITTEDLYPNIKDLETIQNYMADEMGYGEKSDLTNFVDTTFADASAPMQKISKSPSTMRDLNTLVNTIHHRQAVEDTSKVMLEFEGEYIIFSLENQEFGINVRTVQEIISLIPIHALINTPPYIKGMINLRNKVTPVIDLRLNLGMAEAEYSDKTCIIILNVAGLEKTTQLGVIVDAVSEVISITSQDIVNVPSLQKGEKMNYILGMAKIDNDVKILLNTNQLLRDNSEEICCEEVGASPA